WAGRSDVNPEHLGRRFEKHLASAAEDLVRAGQAVILQYHQDGRLVASELYVVSPTMVGAYLFGFDPALREQISVIVLLDSQGVMLADQLGRRTLSLLRGDEPYKLRWRPRPVPNERFVLGRPGSLAGAAGPHYLRARAAAVALAARRLPRLLTLAHAIGAADRKTVLARLRIRPRHRDSQPLI
ncbi:MAG TPA: GNAT family N-acetyltransferase, partial [Actinoplanes sp.]